MLEAEQLKQGEQGWLEVAGEAAGPCALKKRDQMIEGEAIVLRGKLQETQFVEVVCV